MKAKVNWYTRVFRVISAAEALEAGLKHVENIYENHEHRTGRSTWEDEQGRKYRCSEVWEEYSKY